MYRRHITANATEENDLAANDAYYANVIREILNDGRELIDFIPNAGVSLANKRTQTRVPRRRQCRIAETSSRMQQPRQPEYSPAAAVSSRPVSVHLRSVCARASGASWSLADAA